MFFKLSVLGFLLTTSVSFASEKDLNGYFDFQVSEGPALSTEIKQLRAIAANISASVLQGKRKEVIEKISLFPGTVARAYSLRDQNDPKMLLKFMILDDELRSHINLYNENLRKKNRTWRVGAALGSGVLGAAVGGIIYARLYGPDWGGLLGLISGAGAAATITATGALASDMVIRRMESFRSLDHADLQLLGFSNQYVSAQFLASEAKTDIESYLSGSISASNLEDLIFPRDWKMRNFIETWPSLVSEMENYIKALDDQHKLVALSRAIAFQSRVSERIQDYNLTQEDEMYVRRWVGGLAGAGLGALASYKLFGRSGGKEVMMGVAILGVSGAALGYYTIPLVGEFGDNDPGRVNANDFSILDTDLIFD